jgi:hypothetical protein
VTDPIADQCLLNAELAALRADVERMKRQRADGCCLECGSMPDYCRKIWAEQRKCCPDCTHGAALHAENTRLWKQCEQSDALVAAAWANNEALRADVERKDEALRECLEEAGNHVVEYDDGDGTLADIICRALAPAQPLPTTPKAPAFSRLSEELIEKIAQPPKRLTLFEAARAIGEISSVLVSPTPVTPAEPPKPAVADYHTAWCGLDTDHQGLCHPGKKETTKPEPSAVEAKRESMTCEEAGCVSCGFGPDAADRTADDLVAENTVPGRRTIGLMAKERLDDPNTWANAPAPNVAKEPKGWTPDLGAYLRSVQHELTESGFPPSAPEDISFGIAARVHKLREQRDALQAENAELKRENLDLFNQVDEANKLNSKLKQRHIDTDAALMVACVERDELKRRLEEIKAQTKNWKSGLDQNALALEAAEAHNRKLVDEALLRVTEITELKVKVEKAIEALNQRTWLDAIRVNSALRILKGK